MILCIDSSVLVAAMLAGEEFHAESNRVLDTGTPVIYSHGLAEAFSTVTGGGRGMKLSAAIAADVLENDYLPGLTITTLTPGELLRAMNECESRGVRGGAIYDFLHLAAARKAKATKLFTLNVRDFRHFHRDGDPEIAHP
jgi:predicted nucleic acid-binding protein